MAGWLSRATSIFQQSAPPPEPFEVECDCGAKVVGRRLDVYQKPACPRCERPVFVLPANVYPQPKGKSKSKSTKSVESKSKRSPATVVIDDSPPEPSPKSSGGKPVSRSNSLNTQKAASKSVLHQAIPLDLPPSRRITPLRLTAAAILLMSSVTIAGLWHRHRIETAKVTVSHSADEGMAALHEHDFPKAALELNRARAAVDVLGRSDHAANEIRRLSREATTLAALAPSLLTEILEETIANGKPGQTEPLRMSGLYKGAWVIFDALVVPANDSQNRCTIDAPIVFADTKVQVQIESPILRKASQPNASGEAPRVIFAAQLEQLMPPTGQPPASILSLNGKTAFLWTSYDTFAAVGFRPLDSESEEQTRSVLKRQYENLEN